MIQLGRLEVETPDHVVLRYDLAGGGNRGFAALVDFVVATFLVIGMIALWALLESAFPRRAFAATQGVFVLLTLLVGWSYFIVLEWLWEGRTLGKRMFGLRVISADGSPASFTAVLIRNLLRIADFLPAFYGLGLLAIVVSPRSQRLGDLAAGTFVVRAPKPRIDLISLRTVAADGGAAVEVRGLPAELQRLVREFVARERALASKDRARVAASIAGALRARDPGLAESDDAELIRAVARSLRASGEAPSPRGGLRGAQPPSYADGRGPRDRRARHLESSYPSPWGGGHGRQVMTELSYKVPAIHCAGCAATIDEALEPVEGVEGTDVDVDAKTVKVRGTVDDRVIRKVLAASGYPPA